MNTKCVCRRYRSLQPRTRLFVGVGVIGYACFGLVASDASERVFGLVPTKEDEAKLQQWMPKLVSVDKP